MTRLLIAAFLSLPVYAQSGSAELFGKVTDMAGLPIAGAAVSAVEQGSGAHSEQPTNAAGEFHFFALPPGSYSLTASRGGFTTLRKTGIVLRVSDRVPVDLELKVGELLLVMEVIGGAPLLQTTSGTESFVVDNRKILALPLDGRNFVPLLALSPGVAIPPGSTASPSVLPRINGSRPRVNEYLYDGVSVLQPEPGQVAYFPILDGIQEFRLQVNSYSAEYGRSNGGVIQVTTKSGANDLHGSLFEFFRNETLNARNLFAPSSKPPFKRNQYGFALGGPIQRNKTFFFVDWQGTRLRIGNTRISTVPTSLQRQGIFASPVYDPSTTRQDVSGAWLRDPFPGNAIPFDRFDPAATAVLTRYPYPTIAASANNYRRVAVDATDQDQFDTRLDRYFGERQRLFGRYTYLRDHSLPGAPLPDGSGSIASGVIGDGLTRADGVVFEHSYSPKATAVNQFRFGFTRRSLSRSELPNLAIYQIAGFQQIGPSESANSRFTTSVTQFVDTWSTIRSGHSLKLGTDIRLERLNVLQPPDPNGLYSFSNLFSSGLAANGAAVANSGNALASFLLGQVNSFNLDVQRHVLKPRAKIAEFFAQDDWKVNSRLSLGLGLRYTLNFPSTEADNQGAVFNFQTQQLDFLGKNGVSESVRRLHYGDFGPRVSIAFKATDSLALRAGYGLIWLEQAGITTPFTVPYFPFIQSVGQKSLDNINPAFVLSQGPSVRIAPPNPDSGLGQGVFGVDRNTGSGYAQQWNFTVQKTFGTN